MSTPKRPALGRGLDSLIPSMDDTPARGSSAINEIAIDKITPNPEQPRSILMRRLSRNSHVPFASLV